MPRVLLDFHYALVYSKSHSIICSKQITCECLVKQNCWGYKPPTNERILWHESQKRLSSTPSSCLPAGLLWPSSASRGSWSERFWWDFCPRAGTGASHSNTCHNKNKTFKVLTTMHKFCQMKSEIFTLLNVYQFEELAEWAGPSDLLQDLCQRTVCHHPLPQQVSYSSVCADALSQSLVYLHHQMPDISRC